MRRLDGEHGWDDVDSDRFRVFEKSESAEFGVEAGEVDSAKNGEPFGVPVISGPNSECTGKERTYGPPDVDNLSRGTTMERENF